MAQLSQDCFASGAQILSVEDAVAAIVARFSPVDEVEAVALSEADGRVLADDLIATLQLPPFTNSAVDGYAVRGQDLPSGEARAFRVAGRLQAGSTAARAARRAQRSHSHLHRRADARGHGHGVHAGGRPPGRRGPGIVAGWAEARRQRAAGGRGHHVGRVILPAKRWLRPQDVAVAAAMGLTEIRVRTAREGCGVLQRR